MKKQPIGHIVLDYSYLVSNNSLQKSSRDIREKDIMTIIKCKQGTVVIITMNTPGLSTTICILAYHTKTTRAIGAGTLCLGHLDSGHTPFCPMAAVLNVITHFPYQDILPLTRDCARHVIGPTKVK